MTTSSPTIFLSYSHDSDEHAALVLKLADSLTRHGITVIFDKYETHPEGGWPLWTDKGIRDSTFVLMVCTQAYYRRVMGEETPGVGLGVRWEGKVIYNRIYNDPPAGSRYIPILLDGGSTAHVPAPLLGHQRYQLHGFDFSDRGYDELYRHLTNQHRTPRPPAKPLVIRPPDMRPGLNAPEPMENIPYPTVSPDPFSTMENRLDTWLLSLSNREESGLPLDEAVRALFQSVADILRPTPQWLGILDRYSSDSSLPSDLPKEEEYAIRELRNLGLLSHDGKWLFSPTRSEHVYPTFAGALMNALQQGGSTAPAMVAREFVGDLATLQEPLLDVLKSIEATGLIPHGCKDQARILRNRCLIIQTEYFLAQSNKATLTKLGVFLLKYRRPAPVPGVPSRGAKRAP